MLMLASDAIFLYWILLPHCGWGGGVGYKLLLALEGGILCFAVSVCVFPVAVWLCICIGVPRPH